MAERKPFLLRIDRDVLDAVQRWANDDLRSLNAQIEFVLRRALRAEGRLDRPSRPEPRRPSRGSEPEHTRAFAAPASRRTMRRCRSRRFARYRSR